MAAPMDLPAIPRLSRFAALDAHVQHSHARARARLDDDRIDPELRRELVAYWGHVLGPLDQPPSPAGPPAFVRSVAGLFAMVAGSESDVLPEAVIEAAGGCELYVLAISLFDAIQDDELEASLGDFGDAVATNAALVMFVQALDAIAALQEHGPASLRPRVRQCLSRWSLASGTGQHRDLRCVSPTSLDDAVAQAQDKTSAIPMTAALAAMASGCDEQRTALYAAIARNSALIRQAANDLRDLFGKRSSDDLRDGKCNLPVAALLTRGTQGHGQQLERLRQQLPDSMDQIRSLLFESGAVADTARVIEHARREIHAAVAELDRRHAPIAWLAQDADATAARLYSPQGRD